MRTKIAAATFVLIGAGASTIAALDPPINMQGSDTLFLMTQNVITNSGVGINYVGSGSGNGQNNMIATFKGTSVSPNAQTIAPMSRFLNSSGGTTGTCGVNSGSTAEGMAVALDGVSVVTNSTVGPPSCGGVAFDTHLTLTSETYTFNSAFDALRLAYYGIRHDGVGGVCKATGAACTSDAGCVSPDICLGDCNSEARHVLLSNYANIFEAACPSADKVTGTCTTGVRHLWRRDDGSGTTDTFNTLIGGGAATAKFCNTGGRTNALGQVLGGTGKYGFDFEDNDPIRVTCSGNGLTVGEQVCGDAGIAGHLGSLGTLLTVFVPETTDVPVTETYPVGVCTSGVVALLPSTKSTYTGTCPGGNPSFGGKCFSSMFRNTDGTLNANCIQVTGTGKCPTLVPSGTDCRGANAWLRHPDGSIVIDTSVVASRTAPPVPPAGRLYIGAFYKMHVTTKQANGTGLCTQPSSTEQIGCLSSLADPCTFGYAGRSAADVPPAVAQNVGGVVNDIDHIQNLVSHAGPVYPFARKLYVNTVIGFENVTGQELTMVTKYADDAFMDSTTSSPPHIITSNGFILLPPGTGGRRARCEDFDEVANSCTGATGVNACANNPPALQ